MTESKAADTLAPACASHLFRSAVSLWPLIAFRQRPPARVAQWVEAGDLKSPECGFESRPGYQRTGLALDGIEP